MTRVMTTVCLPLELRLKFDFDLWQGLVVCQGLGLYLTLVLGSSLSLIFGLRLELWLGLGFKVRTWFMF